jgi:hypothetical protein
MANSTTQRQTFPSGVPSQDTFDRVFSALDPEQQEASKSSCNGCRIWALAET